MKEGLVRSRLADQVSRAHLPQGNHPLDRRGDETFREACLRLAQILTGRAHLGARRLDAGDGGLGLGLAVIDLLPRCQPGFLELLHALHLPAGAIVRHPGLEFGGLRRLEGRLGLFQDGFRFAVVDPGQGGSPPYFFPFVHVDFPDEPHDFRFHGTPRTSAPGSP